MRFFDMENMKRDSATPLGLVLSRVFDHRVSLRCTLCYAMIPRWGNLIDICEKKRNQLTSFRKA